MSNIDDQEQPFLSHLLELRTRLLHTVYGVLAVFIVLAPFANPIYTGLARPLLASLPQGENMIATGVITPFLTPLKFTLMLSLFIAIPWVLYQIWAFVAPGLYRHEKRLALPMLVSSTMLFYCGMAFAYYVILPIFFSFITATAPEGVTYMPDIEAYLGFVLTLFFAFGVAFEVPIATILITLTGLSTPDALAEKRPYIIVGAFVVGMILTPPDMISQTLLALPMWLLFELGILLSRTMLRRKTEQSDNGLTPDEMDQELDRIEQMDADQGEKR